MLHLDVTLKGRSIGRFDLEGDQIRVGRHPDNEVQIDNSSVSRFHCLLTQDPQSQKWQVEDKGSHNGTFVNGARAFQQDLRNGDTIGIGHFHVLVRTDARRSPGTGVITVRPAADHTTREQRALEKAYLASDTLAVPLLLERDLFQLGSGPSVDLKLPGPPKQALIVRGYGGFQLVAVAMGSAPILVNGADVSDRVWLDEGALIQIEGLRLTFHRGHPETTAESTTMMENPFWKRTTPP